MIADRIAERVLRHQRQRGRYNSTKELAEAVESWIRQEAMDVKIFQALNPFFQCQSHFEHKLGKFKFI